MRIAVGIPSFQEADSIAHVVGQVDEGLARISDAAECVIINADGNSPDGTSHVFRATPTRCAKVGLVTSEHLGKGSNVLALLRHCSDHDIDALALIDADVKTVTPEWPIALAGPVLRGEADYVAPLYRRRRIEGGTTNHLAYPFLYAFFGRRIRQPIGGEFGLSRALIDYLLRQPVEPETCGYGIDIFMTMHALGGGFRVAQQELGYKLHKPSFGKSADIFTQAAATAFGVARQYSLSETADDSEVVYRAIDDVEVSLDRDAALVELTASLARAQELLPVYQDWLGRAPVEMRAELSADEAFLSAGAWAQLAAACAARAILAPRPECSRSLADQLLPAYRVRAISFSRINHHRASELIESEVEVQRNLFSEALRARMNHSRNQGRNPNSA